MIVHHEAVADVVVGELIGGAQGDEWEFTALAQLGVSYRFGAQKQVAPEFVLRNSPTSMPA